MNARIPGYPIEDRDLPVPGGVDMARVTATLRELKVGRANSFLIPADELATDDGRWSTAAVGQRINHAARRIGIKVRTKKEKDAPAGLRVWRIE